MAAGDTFSGGNAKEIAQEWADHEFDADEVASWVDAGCWCPITAGLLREAGFRPTVDEIEYKLGEERNDMDAMYALCNSDVDFDQISW